MKTGTPVQRTKDWKRKRQIGKSLLLCGAAAMMGGCAERKAQAIPWATAIRIRPNPPVRHDASAAEIADIAPDFRIDPPANLGKIFPAHPGPVAPRSRTQNPASAENGNSSKGQLLVPQLSPEETAAAKEQFSQSVAIAERNLAATRGKGLTPGQQDAISKINGFLTEAREASGEGDWTRARNLAKKAQILSQDLVASL